MAYIVVVGCGRLGAHLASEFSRRGHSVVVVDPEEQALALLPPDFGGFRMEGDATEVSVLRQAKADQADQLIAVTRDDNVNLAVAQIAKAVLGVPEVVARVSDPDREAIFRDLGVRTVCPLTLAARELLLGSADSNRDPRNAV